MYEFTPASPVSLDSKTTYYLVVSEGNSSINWTASTDDGEDASSDAGWSIGNVISFRTGDPLGAFQEATTGATGTFEVKGYANSRVLVSNFDQHYISLQARPLTTVIPPTSLRSTTWLSDRPSGLAPARAPTP